ncbi:MAG: hypothetical protein QOE91_2073 [Gaiellaceae bacterium]|nr:hypothetical protein [Gaiellaceae bacterium]
MVSATIGLTGLTGVALASLALSPPAGAAQASRASSLRVTGGQRKLVSVCGRRHHASVVTQGTAVSARVRLRRRGAVFAVDRCSGGRWTRISRGKLRRGRRLTRALPTDAVGDIRVRLRVRRRTRTAYLHVTEDLVDVPVKFQVMNVNRSKLACSSDGGRYTVAGHLSAPRRALAGGAPVALYLHEFSFGQWFWRFQVSGYDYAKALARAGHASVVVDRLGYDESSHPPGDAVCLGSQADVAHQIVSALRSGSYTTAEVPPVRFARVALGAHSVGGVVAEVEAYSFRDVDALVLLAQADQDFTPEVLSVSFQAGLRCGMGGEPADPGGAPGYAYFSDSPEGFRHFSFHTAEQRVADAATAMRNRDPCGDVQSLAAAVAMNQANAPSIAVPVLLLYGTADPAYQQPQAGQDQRNLFSGSKDVTLRFLAGQAHALTLERAAPDVQSAAADWLARRGF